MNYWTLPLYANFYLGNRGTRARMFGGLKFASLMNSLLYYDRNNKLMYRLYNTPNYKKRDLSFLVGLGFNQHLAKGYWLSLDVHYSHNLGNIRTTVKPQNYPEVL